MQGSRKRREGASVVFVRLVACLSLGLGAVTAMASGVTVNSGGSPSYTFPITVPPGIAGMTPTLAIGYTGAGPNGPLGYGWTLQGASMITRCPGSVLSSGRALPVAFTTLDRLCLDGQRLVETNASGTPLAGSPAANAALQDSTGHAEDGSYTEYRTEKDSFARIRAYGMANGAIANGPRYFKVWTKSGQVMELGNGPSSDANTNAMVTASGQGIATAWGVSRTSDTMGNYVDFKYNLRSMSWGSSSIAGNEWDLVEIQYTGNSVTGQAPSNKIVFDYADRPDKTGQAIGQDRSEAYHQASKTVSVKLLNAIRAYVNWPGPALGVTASPGGARIAAPSTAVMVRATKLSYTLGASTGRSVAASIQECVGSAETTCLPKTSFTYSPGATQAYTASAFDSTLGLTPMIATDGSIGVLVADFNGDGRSDILRWSYTATQNQLYMSNGDGTFTQASGFNLNTASTPLFSANACYYSYVGDFNGDGLPDILRYAFTTGANGTACPSPGASVIYMNNGNGSFTPTPIVGPALQRQISNMNGGCNGPGGGSCPVSWTTGKNFYLIDVDGDGKLDIVTSMLRAGSMIPNSGTPPTYSESCPSAVCTHVYKGDGTGNFTDITPASTQALTIFVNPNSAYSLGEPAHVADIDGDGLADFVAMSDLSKGGVNFTSYRSNGDGSFASEPATMTCGFPIDFNGDGRADCLNPGSTASANTLGVATGAATQPKVTNFNLTATGQELVGATLGMVPVDLDGDGRTDLIRWEDDATKNTVYLSNGDGTFRVSPTFNLNTAAFALKKSNGTADFVPGDFTGHGNVEILRMVASPTSGSTATTNQLFVKSVTAPPEQLLSVTTGSGINHAVTWVPLANSASGTIGPRFTPAPATSYPFQNAVPPMWVVATVESQTGVGTSTVKTEYAYSGLRIALDGRGWLGFMKTIEQHVAPDNSLTRLETTYVQDRGYAGSTGVVQSYDAGIGAGGSLLSQTTNAYCDTTSASALPTITVRGTAPASCLSTALVERPYLYQTVTEGWDIDAARTSLPVTTTTNTFDAEGNPTAIVTTTTGTVGGTSQTSTRTINNSYSGENIAGDHWILNHLMGTSANNVVTNSLPNLATSSGSTGASSTASITSGSLAFGSQALNSTAPTRSITITNNGTGSMTLTSLSGLSAPFSLTGNTCSGVAAGGTCTMTVSLATSAAGNWSQAVNSVGATQNFAATVSAAIANDSGPWASGSTQSFCLGQGPTYYRDYTFTITSAAETATFSSMGSSTFNVAPTSWTNGQLLSPGTYGFRISVSNSGVVPLSITFGGTGHVLTTSLVTANKQTCP